MLTASISGWPICFHNKGHYTLFNPWTSKLKRNSYNDMSLCNHVSVCIPFWTCLIYFPPLCWVSTLIKGKNTERSQALKAFIEYVKEFTQNSDNKWVKNKQEEQINLSIKNKIFACMYVRVCMCLGVFLLNLKIYIKHGNYIKSLSLE